MSENSERQTSKTADAQVAGAQTAAETAPEVSADRSAPSRRPGQISGTLAAIVILVLVGVIAWLGYTFWNAAPPERMVKKGSSAHANSGPTGEARLPAAYYKRTGQKPPPGG